VEHREKLFDKGKGVTRKKEVVPRPGRLRAEEKRSDTSQQPIRGKAKGALLRNPSRGKKNFPPETPAWLVALNH